MSIFKIIEKMCNNLDIHSLSFYGTFESSRFHCNKKSENENESENRGKILAWQYLFSFSLCNCKFSRSRFSMGAKAIAKTRKLSFLVKP